jgi:nucleotide-binding universal stress UspA family protein
MKIASILCPTDYSEPSRHAMEYAVAIARWSGARIIPLHVEVGAFATVPALVGGGPETAADTQIVRGASPAETIADFAASSCVDLIVIGTHGASGFRQLILGSVTEKVLRDVDCPVLTVPPHAHSTAQLPFRRVLSATDFSPSSLAALQLARSLAEDCHASLDILHVIDEPDEYALFVARSYDVHHHAEVNTRRIAEHLKQIVPPAAPGHSRVRVRIARGVAEDEILRIGWESCADLIVLGVGRGKAPVFGSTVNHVVRHARCPVLTVRHENGG